MQAFFGCRLSHSLQEEMKLALACTVCCCPTATPRSALPQLAPACSFSTLPLFLPCAALACLPSHCAVEIANYASKHSWSKGKQGKGEVPLQLQGILLTSYRVNT